MDILMLLYRVGFEWVLQDLTYPSIDYIVIATEDYSA